MSKVVDFKKPETENYVGETKYFEVLRDTPEKILEVLNGKKEDGTEYTIEDLQRLFTEELYAFKAFIESNYNHEQIPELKEVEKVLMSEFDANDKRIEETFYTLENTKEVNGSELAGKVVRFLEKVEVEFRGTQVVLDCINYWSGLSDKKIKEKKVQHAVFDTTLRLINTLKYKGHADLLDIVCINDWFMPSHNEYNKNLIYMHVLSAKHQEILQMINPNMAENNPAYMG